MTIRSGFFNSVNGDRKYDAKRFAEYFATFIANGVFPNPSTNFQVVSNNDMTVTVKPGKAWINGYVAIDDEDYILTIDSADGALNRIDRVVLRWDAVDREIRIEVKKGTFASSPVAPSLQRDADAYELGIADIRFNKGAVSITQASITDLRLSNEYCGIVHGLVEQVDTEVLFQDYLSWINQKKDEFNTDLVDYRTLKQGEIDNIVADFQNDFITWFATIQDILNENVAGNLLDIINQFKDSKGQPDGIASLDDEGQVPVEQLENVEYLKEFYGRGTIINRIEPRVDSLWYTKNGITFDFKTFRRHVLNTSTLSLDAGGKSEPTYDVYIKYKTAPTDGNSYLSITARDSTTQQIMSLYCTGGASTTSNSVLVAYSSNTYDLTNVDYIDIESSASQSNNSILRNSYIGISRDNSSSHLASSFERYIGFQVNSGEAMNFSREVRRIDVRDLTGGFLLKMSAYQASNSTTTSAYFSHYIYGIKFIGKSGVEINPDIKLSLVDGATEGTVAFKEHTLPAYALDWNSLNSMVDVPNNTSVQFDIYDNHNNVLKSNVRNGELFQEFANPIIIPKVTLKRNSPTDPPPTLSSLTLGYRSSGSVGGWVKVNEITLDTNSPRVTVGNLSGYRELKIKVKNFRPSSTTGNLSMVFNNNNGSVYTQNAIIYDVSSTFRGTTSGPGTQNSSLELSFTGSYMTNTPSGEAYIVNLTNDGDFMPYGTIERFGKAGRFTYISPYSYNVPEFVDTISIYTTTSTVSILAGTIIEVWGR